MLVFFLVVLSCAESAFANAVWYRKYGSVYARGVVTDDAGQRIWAEFNDNGEMVRELGPQGDTSHKAMSAAAYRQYVAMVQSTVAEYGGNAVVKSRSEYQSETYTTRDGFTIVKPGLKPETLTVVTRNPESMYGDVQHELLLAEVPIDINQSIPASAESLIVDKSGNVLKVSNYNIGFKVGFFQKANGEIETGNHLEEVGLFCGLAWDESSPTTNSGSGYQFRCTNDQPLEDQVIFSSIGNIPSAFIFKREAEDKIFAPLKNVPISMGLPYPSGQATTREDGSYDMKYFLPPCLGFAWIPSYAFAQLHHRHFNPRAEDPIEPYFLRQVDFDFCVGGGLLGGTSMADLAVAAGSNANNESGYEGAPYMLAGPMELGMTAAQWDFPLFLKNPLDFPVDTLWVAGKAYLEGPSGQALKPSGSTQYQYSGSTPQRTAQDNYDFDADGLVDISVLGEVVDGDFQAGGSQIMQGVYLSGQPNRPDAEEEELRKPNFVRRADWGADLKDQGLLTSISRDDFKNTDIYVFRESNGQMIGERHGLNKDEGDQANAGVDDNAGKFFYNMTFMGPRDRFTAVPNYAQFTIDIRLPVLDVDSYNIDYADTPLKWIPGPMGRIPFIDKESELVKQDGNYDEILHWSEIPFSKFQQHNEMNPELYERESDHLRPGERVKVVAINRATGYMGSLVTPVYVAGEGGESGAEITFAVDDIAMGPPNLKVWARRSTTVEHGFTAGEAREYAIASEGAGLSSDASIEVYTEWLDHDGTALPEGLQDYGFTGRLAKLVADKKLGNTSVAHFPIHPGRHIQVIQVQNSDLSAEHLYFQVNGQPVSRNPDFGGSSNGAGPLNERPEHFVPFKVPVFNEVASLKQYNAYRYYQQDIANEVLESPDSVYVWKYRPEYTFSVFDLKVQDIQRQVDEETLENILTSEQPVLSAEDLWLSIIYDLGITNLEPLDRFTGGQELVFAVGEEETLVTVGKDGLLKFENLDHLSAIATEDLTTIRLYSNSDVGNVLWEFAFGGLMVFPPRQGEGEPIEISADFAEDNVITAVSLLDSGGKPISLEWEADGDAVVDVPFQSKADGFFSTKVDFSTEVGAISTVSAKVDMGTYYSATFETVPGEPRTITFSQTGSTAISGLGGVELRAHITDQFGNAVADGTPVEFSAPSLAVSGERVTHGGNVVLNAVGTHEPGAQTVKMKAGDATAQTTVNVEDITLSISMPNEIETGETVDVTVSAYSGYGNLSGLAIDVGFIRASANRSRYVLAGNSVTFPAYVGSIRGEGRISAAVSDQIVIHPFTVVDKPGGYFLDTLIVGDAVGPGSVSVGNATYNYSNATHIVAEGNPGESITLSLNNNLSPPLLPLLQYSMQRDPQAGQIRDEIVGVPAGTENLATVDESFLSYLRAFQFGDSSRITIQYDQLSPINAIGFVMHLKPDGLSGNIFDYPSLKLRLALENGRLVWSRQNGGAEYRVVSEPLNSASWIRVGARWSAGQLVLQVDNDLYQTQSNIPITMPVSGANSTVFVGGGYTGLMAALQIFDLGSQSAVTFGDGSLTKVVTVGANGKAVEPVMAHASAYVAVNQRRALFQYQQHDGFSLVQTAIAADLDCRPPVAGSIDRFGQIMDAAEAYLHLLAECNYKSRLRTAVVTLTHENSSFVQRELAIVDLAFYGPLYASIKAVELGITVAPACANGIVMGDVDDLASGTCDFITSLLLVGDVRDLILHNFWLWTNAVDENGKQKFDQATYVFASLGILTTLAEATGVGTILDAAVGGCKTASKLMKGSRLMDGIADYVLKHKAVWTKPTQLQTALKPILPLMQVTALIVYLGPQNPEMKPTWDLLSNINRDQLVGWMAYLPHAIEQSLPSLASTNPVPNNVLDFFFSSAYAAAPFDFIRLLDETGQLRGFLKAVKTVMEEAQEKVNGYRGNNSYLAQAFNTVIAQLGEDFDKLPLETIQKNLADSRMLTAMLVAYDLGKGSDELIKAMRRFPCVPSNCHLGGLSALGLSGPETIARYFDSFGEIANFMAQGKLSPQAYEEMGQVIAQLGTMKKDGSAVKFNVAKGASEVIALTLKMLKNGHEVTHFEFHTVMRNSGGEELGERIYDIVAKINNATVRIESKAWVPTVLNDRLIGSLGCKMVGEAGQQEEKFQKVGQLQKDLIDAIVATRKGEPITVKWVFDGRVKEDNIDDAIDAILDKFQTSNTFREGFLMQLNARGLNIHEPADKREIDIFFESQLPNVLAAVLKIE